MEMLEETNETERERERDGGVGAVAASVGEMCDGHDEMLTKYSF